MVASTWGAITAAEAPCRIRPQISTKPLGANPQVIEANVKHAIPVMNMRLRP